MKFGYARVSTTDQNLDLQIDALKKAGCQNIVEEKISAGKERPALNTLISKLRKDDCVVIWKLDRLGRSLKELIQIITLFNKIEVTLISLNEGIDTTTATGRFTFSIFGALAEFEKDIIRERTKAGLASARARGRFGGRPKGLDKKAIEKAKTVKILYDKGKNMKEIAIVLNIGSATGYRYLKYFKKNSEL